MRGADRSIQRVLVTGGGGFLGRAIARELAKPDGPLGRAPEEILLLDLEVDGAALPPGTTPIVADVRDAEAVRRACRGVDAVVHAASLVDWGEATPERLEEVNVGGTENVLAACREEGVPSLVYTSSMDVVCGTRPVVDADESLPYPERFANDYARTKALAEQRVLAAHGSPRSARDGEEPGSGRLATCAIRPCGMYGEGDPYHVANVLRVVRAGRLPFRLGDGKAAFQHVYVGNVAHAHVLALQRLFDGNPAVGGESYFITDDTPAVDFLEFMEQVLEPLGETLPPRTRRVPYPVVYALGAAAEAAAVACRPFFRFVPTLTRSSVRFVCHTHTFDGRKARRDLGYEPLYGEAEALSRTIEYFRQADL
ncbi:MAG: NAD-dependent epimerase/dehydratase family protein [Myxococcota bacterium]